MIEIGINPILVSVGAFALRWYSLMVLLAIVVAAAWTSRALRGQKELPRDSIYTLGVWAIPGGIVGSRLVHIIDQLDFYLANPRAILGGEGQAIYGAILGAAVAMWLGSRVHHIPLFSRLLDLAAPGIPLAHSVGRIANIINGDATGRTTSLPWGFVYTHPNTYAPQGVATHPSPVYEILWNLIIFLILFRLRGRLKPDGSLFLIYLGLYSLGRFFINFTRESSPFLLGLHQAQIIALGVLAVSLFLLVGRVRWAKAEATVASGEGGGGDSPEEGGR